MWKTVWDIGFTLSSFGATFVFGVAIGNLVQGFPVDERGVYVGTLTGLFTFYSLATGAFAVVTFAMHGAMFLFLKTTGPVNERLKRWIWHTWGLFLVVYILVSMMTLIEHRHIIENVRRAPWAIPIVIVNVLCVANIPRAVFKGSFGQAFVCSCLNIACLVAIFMVSTFPNMIYSTSEHPSLTIYNAASSQGTLWLMCIIAMIGVPLITAYTIIVYWTFRQKIGEDDI